MRSHLVAEHRPNRDLITKTTLFSAVDALILSTPAVVSSRTGSQAKVAGDEEPPMFITDPIPDNSGVVRSRGRQPRLRVQPYARHSDDSSRSASAQHNKGTHLGTGSSRGPSPVSQSFNPSPVMASSSRLTQVAFSQANSHSLSSEREMMVDESEALVGDYEGEPESPVNEAEDASDGSGSEENEGSIFSQAGYKIINLAYLHTLPPRRLITCTGCLIGITPKSALSHFHQKHQIKLTKVQNKKLKEVLESHHFESDSNSIDPPKVPCPPIEGLEVSDGLACDFCTYCCKAQRSMSNHSSAVHRDIQGASKDSCHKVRVQAFFTQRPKFFEVNPSLHGLKEDDLFSVYMRTYAPKIEKSRDLNPPQSVNEIPPLLKVMQWHEHLATYTTDQTKVKELLEIWTIPTHTQGEAWMGNRLRLTIEGYMKDIRKKAIDTPIGIKQLLMVCPRYVLSSFMNVQQLFIIIRLTQLDEYWTPLHDDRTISEYARLLHHWTCAILVTTEDHSSGYKFSLTPGDYERAKKLKSGLQSPKDVVLFETFHDFIKPFLYPKKE